MRERCSMIDTLVPNGLTLLAGKRKSGKTRWALFAAAQVAEREKVLFISTRMNDHATARLLHSVLGEPGGPAWPDTLTFEADWPLPLEGGLTALERCVEATGRPLVVIDAGLPWHEPEVELALARIAERCGCRILLVLDLKQGQGAETIAKTTLTWTLEKGEGVLVRVRVSSRSVPGFEALLRFEKASGWTLELPQ